MAQEEKKNEETPQKIKILLVVTNHNKLGDSKKQTGWYLPEVSEPYYFFKGHGFDVTFGSIQGGFAEVDEGSVKNYGKEPSCARFVKEFLEPNQGKYLETLAISALNASKYHVVFFAGGHGTMWDFPNDTILHTFTQKVYDNRGIVSAVCHGPSALLNLKDKNNEYLIHNREVTGFSNDEEEAVGLSKVVPFLLEDELKKRGAKYSCSDKFKNHVVSSDRVITGQNPASSLNCARAILKELSKLYGIKDDVIVDVLLVVTSHNKLGDSGKHTGWHLSEVAHPYYKFIERGYKVTFASPKGGLASVDPNSVKTFEEDPESAKFYSDKCDKDGKLETIAISALNIKKYQVLMFAGGHGTMWDLPNDTIVQGAVETAYKNGSIVAAICHGPAALVNAKNDKGEPLVKGKKLTCFSNVEEDESKATSLMPFLLEDALTKNGALYSKAPKSWGCHVVADGMLITGENPASAHKLAEEIIDAVQKHCSH